jgi:hypothetical protein
MLTGWNSAEPTASRQYDERRRTILAQQTWSNLLCWKLDDGEIGEVLEFMERLPVSRAID